MTGPKAAALLSIAHERARLKSRAITAYAKGDLGSGVWLAQLRDELGRQHMRIEGVQFDE